MRPVISLHVHFGGLHTQIEHRIPNHLGIAFVSGDLVPEFVCARVGRSGNHLHMLRFFAAQVRRCT